MIETNAVTKKFIEEKEKYITLHWSKNNHLDHDRHQRRIKHVGSFCTGDTLEVGSADGRTTNWLQQWFPQCTFYGIEITDWGYQNAIKQYPKIPFDQGCAEDTPYENEAFNTVLMAEILEHVEDPKKVVKEGWRICSEKLILTSPINKKGMLADPDHKRYLDHTMMKALLIQCGINPNLATFHDLNAKGYPEDNERLAYFGVTIINKR